jgi:CBS domain-containing protein
VEHGSDEAARLDASAEPLQAVKALALGLILFSIGRVFESRHLRAVGRGFLRVSLVGAGATFVLVFVGVLIAAVLTGSPSSLGTSVILAVLLGLAAIATAPAATLITLQEYEAKGSASDAVLTVTGFTDALCIILFQLVFLLLAVAGVLYSPTIGSSGIWLGLGLSIGGSILLGSTAGFMLSVLHAKLQVAETLLILLAAMIVLSAGERWLLEHVGNSYNFLLTALCAGAVFTNIAIDPDRMDSVIQTVGPPLFVGFFVLAGYQLHLEDLSQLRGVGVAYVVCRVMGKVGGTWLGVRWAGGLADMKPHIGVGLLCHAAVAIGLVDYVAVHWHDTEAARTFATTILGSAVLFEISGPVLLKLLVVRCGEVKAVTLLRRTGSAGGQSMFSLTAEALMRVVRPRRVRAGGDEALRVRHIMRTDVKTIPAAASLDDVLHLVEKSRFNHFPVTDERDRLIGIIRLSDLQEVIYDPIVSNLVTADDLCNTNVPVVAVDMPLEEIQAVFRVNKLSSLPVVDDPESRHVVGLVERRDLLQVLRPKQS